MSAIASQMDGPNGKTFLKIQKNHFRKYPIRVEGKIFLVTHNHSA